jgi:methionyl aminopeptidase
VKYAPDGVRHVPETIARPSRRDPPRRPERLSAAQVRRLAAACEIASDVLADVAARIAPGVTTDELDQIAHASLVERGAYPSPLGYQGYPRSICTSVNEVVCHGIPGDEELRDGDLVKVDVTAFAHGMHGDLCQTFAVGTVDAAARELMAVTRHALSAGIGAVGPGGHVRDIGRAIEATVGPGYGVVHQFTGHEIGRFFHGAMVIPHVDTPGMDWVLAPGMALTVEPMINEGAAAAAILADGWTAVTVDGGRSAQYEHTVVVTADGHDVLTRHVPEES